MWQLLWIIPKNLLSRIVGRLARVRWPGPIRLMFLQWFAARYRLNMGEAEKPLFQYGTVQELFTRRLKPGVRPISNEPAVHPADGLLSVAGEIQDGQLLQAKGWTYSVDEFLGEKGAAAEFIGGQFLTYYLCPTDYHRVHSPVSGSVFKTTYIPGDLWPVNAWSVLNVRRLFVRNERVVVWMESAYGRVAVVLVGATNVGQMTLAFDPSVITNQGGKPFKKIYDPGIKLAAGDELGVFHMGSTVIVLYPKSFPLNPGNSPRPVLYGQP